MGFISKIVVKLGFPRTRGMPYSQEWGGKSGQLKERVAGETRLLVGRPTGHDRATETIKGETFHR